MVSAALLEMRYARIHEFFVTPSGVKGWSYCSSVVRRVLEETEGSGLCFLLT